MVTRRFAISLRRFPMKETVLLVYPPSTLTFSPINNIQSHFAGSGSKKDAIKEKSGRPTEDSNKRDRTKSGIYFHF